VLGNGSSSWKEEVHPEAAASAVGGAPTSRQASSNSRSTPCRPATPRDSPANRPASAGRRRALAALTRIDQSGLPPNGPTPANCPCAIALRRGPRQPSTASRNRSARFRSAGSRARREARRATPTERAAPRMHLRIDDVHSRLLRHRLDWHRDRHDVGLNLQLGGGEPLELPAADRRTSLDPKLVARTGGPEGAAWRRLPPPQPGIPTLPRPAQCPAREIPAKPGPAHTVAWLLLWMPVDGAGELFGVCSGFGAASVDKRATVRRLCLTCGTAGIFLSPHHPGREPRSAPLPQMDLQQLPPAPSTPVRLAFIRAAVDRGEPQQVVVCGYGRRRAHAPAAARRKRRGLGSRAGAQ
jgi:hypothetical protein